MFEENKEIDNSGGVAGAVAFQGASAVSGSVDNKLASVRYSGPGPMVIDHNVFVDSIIIEDGTEVTFNGEVSVSNVVLLGSAKAYFNGPLTSITSSLSVDGGKVVINSANGFLYGKISISGEGSVCWNDEIISAGDDLKLSFGSYDQTADVPAAAKEANDAEVESVEDAVDVSLAPVAYVSEFNSSRSGVGLDGEVYINGNFTVATGTNQLRDINGVALDLGVDSAVNFDDVKSAEENPEVIADTALAAADSAIETVLTGVQALAVDDAV